MSRTTRLTQPKKRERNLERPAGLPTSNTQKASPPFIYVHYPQSWEWVGTLDSKGKRFGWLPRPKRIIAQPGCNGVTDPGMGNEVTFDNMRGTLNAAASKGAQIIYPSEPALGEYRDYDQYYDTLAGGKWYVEPGQEAVVLPTGQILWNNDDVIPAALEFRRHLRDHVITEPLMREFFLGKMAIEKQHLSRFIQMAGNNPGLQFKVDAQQAKIEQMEQDYESYTADLLADAEPIRAPRKRAGKLKPPEKT